MLVSMTLFEKLRKRRDARRLEHGKETAAELEAEARGETYTVNMAITRDPKKPGGWGDINLSSTFRLVDANGVPLSRRNYGGGTNLGDHTELSLMFGRDDWNGEGAGQPAKLIWEVPTATADVEAPFEFVDVPLP